jgi:hypothetical protein
MLEVLMAARCADIAPAIGLQFSDEIARVPAHRASDYGPLKWLCNQPADECRCRGYTFAASRMNDSRPLRQTTARDRAAFKSMKTKKLTELLERIEAWPPEAQNQLADFALELDAG